MTSALHLREASRNAKRYGRLVQGKLVPEAVSFRELLVGRFEVTLAQFAQFEPGFRVPCGRENFPVGAVTVEMAKAYCAWLSAITGEHWRLPTAAETATLYGPAEEGVTENTLNHWAGYAPNPEDAARLRGKVEKLGGPGSLLREVGSFGGRGGETLVFDLGGNVVEWTTVEQGRGALRGGSADISSDAKANEMGASLPCQGFRVVKELRDGTAKAEPA